MKKHLTCYLIPFILLFSRISGFAQDYHVRIGFIGNSITIGSGLANAQRDCYPSQFARMLKETYGDTCIVENFAVSGRTMLKKGDFPIWNESSFRNGWNFAPDIFFICMGTNDSKPYNWDVYGNEFIGDYLSMIDTFKVRNPHTRFIVCYPPPAFAVVYDIRNSVILNSVIPAVDSVLSKTDATLLDFYHPLLNSESLFPDKIHPGVEGATKMAKLVYDKFIETDVVHRVEHGQTFVTDLKSSTVSLAVKDSATISWTTINADSAFFNGKKVDVNGSIKVAPLDTTIYTLKAYGAKTTDSLQFIQNVYFPDLTKMEVTPTNTHISEGDSIFLKLTYYDQFGKIIKNQLYDMSWTIIKGLGELVNQTDTSVVFVAGSRTGGKAYIKAESNGINIQAVFAIGAATGLSNPTIQDEIKTFPNPFSRQISFSLFSTNTSPVRIVLYDLKGEKVKEKTYQVTKSGTQTMTMNTTDLKAGVFIYEIAHAGKTYTGKVSKPVLK